MARTGYAKPQLNVGYRTNNYRNSKSAKTKAIKPQKIKNRKSSTITTIFMSILSFVWVTPILVVVLNSFKKKAYIFRNPFGLS